MSGADEDPRRPVSSGTGAPPPRRSGASGSSGESSAAPAPPLGHPTVVAPAPDAKSTVAPGRDEVAASGEGSGATGDGRRRRRAGPDGGVATRRSPWWLRAVAWVVAVPLGLVLVGIPARRAGYLSSQKLLDIVIGKGNGRYMPLVVIVLLWAVVTAILVQVIIEGGSWLLRRRQRRRAARGDAA